MSNLKNIQSLQNTFNDICKKNYNIIINEQDFFFSYLIQNDHIDILINNSNDVEFFSLYIFDIINIAYNKNNNKIQISTNNREDYLFFNADAQHYGELIFVNILKAISDFKNKKTNIQSL